MIETKVQSKRPHLRQTIREPTSRPIAFADFVYRVHTESVEVKDESHGDLDCIGTVEEKGRNSNDSRITLLHLLHYVYYSTYVQAIDDAIPAEANHNPATAKSFQIV